MLFCCPHDQYNNCYLGPAWNTTLCPDPVSCAKQCALDGADYLQSYGVHSDGNKLSLNFVTQTQVLHSHLGLFGMMYVFTGIL